MTRKPIRFLGKRRTDLFELAALQYHSRLRWFPVRDRLQQALHRQPDSSALIIDWQRWRVGTPAIGTEIPWRFKALVEGSSPSRPILFSFGSP